MIKKKISLYLILFLPFSVLCQVNLNLQQVIDSVLKNSYDIQIARNIAELNKNNNRYGLAGALPTIAINSADNQSSTNLHQLYADSSEINRTNTGSNSFSAGLNASITLFNGMKVIATKDKLSHLQKQGEQLLNSQVQNSVASVMIKYFDIIRQQSYLDIMKGAQELSKKKLEIITERRNVGMANDADLMQAQIDYNLAGQQVKNQQLILDQVKTDLLQLMCVKKYFNFEIKDSIVTDNSLRIDSIVSRLNQNPQFLSYDQQVKINEQIAKELNAQRYPSLKLITGYNFNYTKSDAGFTLLNQYYGPSIGVSLQVPLYNGGIYKIQHDAALYNLDNAKLQKEGLANTLMASAIKTHQSYLNAIEQISSQTNNFELAGKLANLVLMRFQLNQATVLEMKSAQESYENAGYMLVNLQFAAKVAEIQLKTLCYQLKY